MKKTNRQQQKEQTKELLLKTAFEMFSSQGIMKTRMSDIARAAEVSHGTVFAHFQTQEALIEEVVGHYCREIAKRTHSLAETCESMEELLKAHLEGIMEYERFYTCLIIESRLLPSGARNSWVVIQSALSMHFSKVCERDGELKNILLQSGTDSKDNTNKGIPAYMLFNLWMGLIHYYLENGDLFAPDGNVLSRYQETLIESYIRLLKRK